MARPEFLTGTVGGDGGVSMMRPEYHGFSRFTTIASSSGWKLILPAWCAESERQELF